MPIGRTPSASGAAEGAAPSAARVRESEEASEGLLVADGISKLFGPVRALDDVSITLRRAEVHALLGENGAGKSTLVAVLNGTLEADSGTVSLAGIGLGARRSLEVARSIATVHQDLMLVPSMTGLENIALALNQPAGRSTRAVVAEIQQRFGLVAHLDTTVRDLELPEQQRIELLRALCQRPSVLLLDEPTSFLAPAAIKPFLHGVRVLAREGIAVVFITHRLDEIRDVADRVTVLRRGRVVARYEGSLPSNTKLAVAMVGTSVVQPEQTQPTRDDVVIEARELSVARGPRDLAVNSVSLTVHRAEIVGIAGVDGNGQMELLEALAGLRPLEAGTIIYLSNDVSHIAYRGRSDRGIHFVSGQRRRFGIVPTFTALQHFQYVLGADVWSRVPELLAEFDVHPADPMVRADRLSGGNQQKMMMARACARQPILLILTYPTSGLDVRASVNVRALLLAEAKRGTAILVASSELDELQTICHRILVMSRGRIVGEQRLGHFDAVQLGRWFSGDGDEVA